MAAFRVVKVAIAAVAATFVASCSNEGASDAAEHALDRAAIAQGLLGEDDAPPTGVFERLQGKTRDRLCVVGSAEDGWRFAAEWRTTDRGSCMTSGTIKVAAAEEPADEAAAQRWRVRFHGVPGCDVDVLAQADQIRFPATLPTACAPLCDGKIGLAAAELDRTSWSEEEALKVRLRGADGKVRVNCGQKII